MFIKYCVLSLYILSTFISFSTAKHNKYKVYNFEDNKICSGITKRKLKLDAGYTEAILITQKTTKDHRYTWDKNYECSFIIESDEGLFVVVQSINFRKNATTGKCMDFVKFNTKTLQYHEDVCGRLNVVNGNEDIYYYTKDRYGYIETKIFISKEKLNNDFDMDLKIVFTRYKSCDATYSACDTRSEGLCIHNDLFNDSYVNCPVDNCFDETNCELLTKKLNIKNCGLDDCNLIENDANSTKIILSAVTSLVISFVVFVVCIWIFKKTGKLCWAASCSETPPPRQPSRVIEMQNRTEVNEAQVAAAPDPEKDLPPSYESLFPSR